MALDIESTEEQQPPALLLPPRPAGIKSSGEEAAICMRHFTMGVEKQGGVGGVRSGLVEFRTVEHMYVLMRFYM